MLSSSKVNKAEGARGRPAPGKEGFKEITTEKGRSYVAGELLITFQEDASDEGIEAIALELGGTVSKVKDSSATHERRATILFADDADIEALAERASSHDAVLYAYPNDAYTLH